MPSMRLDCWKAELPSLVMRRTVTWYMKPRASSPAIVEPPQAAEPSSSKRVVTMPCTRRSGSPYFVVSHWAQLSDWTSVV